MIGNPRPGIEITRDTVVIKCSGNSRLIKGRPGLPRNK